MEARLRCHSCRSDDLILREACLEWAEYDGGLIVNGQGQIEAVGDCYRSPGDIQPKLTSIECRSCGHEWRPRRQFNGVRA